MDLVLMPFRRAFDYSGRSRRREYWLYALLALIAFVLVNDVLPKSVSDKLVLMLMLGLAIPGIAVTVRRLHDIGRSGWWMALPGAPVAFWAVALIGGFSSDRLFHLVLPMVVIAPIALLVLLATKGQQGPNLYGPDPKGVPEGL